MANDAINFRSSCIKTLSAVEVRPDRSNQHEFNGVQALKNLFGLERVSSEARFSIRGESVECISGVTWYDAREAHPSRSEHRLYFQTNNVMAQAQEGDNIVIGFGRDNSLQFVLIKNGSQGHSGRIQNWLEE
ncbi:type II restriction endonuclease [Rugamonas sp. FT107W]|uniref:Type II restriction endonuclease n=1 Tax=Duganella vulcania TaxID=2692166 RepID=A0A845HI86_9BURK|nr:type II restriction endonuclease [Duganella vulcania]MYN17123.1 type II restriction endonuclease [Duganella vulcania]